MARKRRKAVNKDDITAEILRCRSKASLLVKAIDEAQESIGFEVAELSSLLISYSHSIEVVSDAFLNRADNAIEKEAIA